MTIIIDPTNLISGGDTGTAFLAPITLNTTTFVLQIAPGTGILPNAYDGVSGQAFYSALKLLWKNNSTYIKFPFPMVAITPEQFELVYPWTFADNTTRKSFRSAGWVERNSAGNITSMWAGIVSLGSLGSTDQPYYQQASGGAATNFTFQGPVNEAVQVLSDPNGDGVYTDGFDYRGYFKMFAREYQKNYAVSQLADIGVSALSYITYRFPLANSADLAITHNDTAVAASPYTGVIITYYGSAQVRNIGGTNYNFNTIITGASLTAEQIYEKVEYLLRQNSDIDSGAGVVNGKTADSLLKFVGSTLVTSQGVYIDGFNSADTNRIQFYDNTNTQRTFPYVATGSLVFNANLVADSTAKYWLFFTSGYGTSSAIIVNDSAGNPITGTVGGAASIAYTFAYDANVQGGRTAGTDAAVTAVAIGTNLAQYIVGTRTITRASSQDISLTSSLERNYLNP